MQVLLFVAIATRIESLDIRGNLCLNQSVCIHFNTIRAEIASNVLFVVQVACYYIGNWAQMVQIVVV